MSFAPEMTSSYMASNSTIASWSKLQEKYIGKRCHEQSQKNMILCKVIHRNESVCALVSRIWHPKSTNHMHQETGAEWTLFAVAPPKFNPLLFTHMRTCPGKWNEIHALVLVKPCTEGTSYLRLP